MKISRLFAFTACILTLWQAAPRAHGGVNFTTLVSFNDATNGANPYSPPVLLPDGNLYGVAPYGGTNGGGIVYKVTTNAQMTLLHIFDTSDGSFPLGQLAAGNDGNLYGTTAAGGTNNAGTIFNISTNGTLTTFYSFGSETNDVGYGLDGTGPYGGVIQGQDGNFYGTTYQGGTSNVGTIFEFLTNGTLTTLYSFTGDSSNDDGAYPFIAPLVEGVKGVFYGTTSAGGTNNDGTVFQICTNGTLTILHEFDNTDGRAPRAGLNWGSDSNLYGTTIEGGTNGFGTVFKITTNGNFTVLFQFNTNTGFFPQGGILCTSTSNNLYGTTYGGGTQGYGSVFSLTTNGVLTTLYSFGDLDDGGNPCAGVIRDGNGNLYGTTFVGGTVGYGTVFSLWNTNIPTLSITAPISNQRCTNSVFTVAGTASDNIGVANVFYSLNNSAWTNASTANNWTNWTQQVVLAPGTNILAAYAENQSGNLSITDTVQFDFVVTNLITLQTAGSGTISPNYSNAWLEVGRNYSMTATAGKGFIFTNWAGGTSEPLSLLTNGPTLQFMMQSNLILQADFYETNKPVISITNITSGMLVSNSSFNVMGWATDNVAVASVYYSVSNSVFDTGFLPALTTNNWKNWSTNVTLSPGTNLIAAYALDTIGNISPTNNTKLVYVLSAPLTVQTNGLGSITPNDNRAVLQIGVNYTLTATAGKGFMFTNWTGGTSQPLSVLTNGPILQFMMQSNLVLQANFVDTNRPVVSITNITSGMLVSNSSFTVMGTATDNVAVASVYYSLSNAVMNTGFMPALTTNNWKNWSTNVTLSPGTNLVAAYAVDTSGNISLTNSTKLVYVLSAPLTVQTNGLGSISPNDNGALLQIGVDYTLTATAGTGFMFTNWTGGTSEPLSLLTNGAALQFAMQSNLVLQANFIETGKPTLTITAPTSGQHMTNALATVVGTASDDWKVTGVWYQLNGGQWNQPASTNNWTNWMTTVELQAATNTIKAYAMDMGGNLSSTNSVSFVSSNAFMLQLAVVPGQPLTSNGLSFALNISPNLDGHIQVSTNLLNWTILTNFVGTNTTLDFQDQAATNFDDRFYRAVIP